MFLHHCSLVIADCMLVLILLLLKLHFKKQIFNYHGAFCISENAINSTSNTSTFINWSRLHVSMVNQNQRGRYIDKT